MAQRHNQSHLAIRHVPYLRPTCFLPIANYFANIFSTIAHFISLKQLLERLNFKSKGIVALLEE